MRGYEKGDSPFLCRVMAGPRKPATTVSALSIHGIDNARVGAIGRFFILRVIGTGVYCNRNEAHSLLPVCCFATLTLYGWQSKKEAK